MNITIAHACAAAALVLSLGAAGCSAPDVDVAKVVKLAEITTGWFDVGIVDGQNKLVPTRSCPSPTGNGDAERPPDLRRLPVHRRNRGTRFEPLRAPGRGRPRAERDQQTNHVPARTGDSPGCSPRADADAQPVQGRARRGVRQARAKPFVKIGEAAGGETVADEVVRSQKPEDALYRSRFFTMERSGRDHAARGDSSDASFSTSLRSCTS